jgi:hypothetical protein
MGAVAGADEAEQTPLAPAETQQVSPEQGRRQQPSTPEPEPSTDQGQQQSSTPEPEQAPPAPGFGERGRMRRRARFLRKARELAYRDLGGLVFDLHRFGQRNDPLVLAKLATLRQIDTELRELEEVLDDRRSVMVLREVGIAACPRCAAIHGSDDRFCPGCGLAFDSNADRPISTAPVSPQAQAAHMAVAAVAAPTTAQLAGQGPSTQVLPGQTSVFSDSAPNASPSPRSPASSGSLPDSGPTAPAASTPPVARPAPSPMEPAPAMKSTPPVPAKPASPPPGSEPRASDRVEEDEPTQILRPPRGDGSA